MLTQYAEVDRIAAGIALARCNLIEIGAGFLRPFPSCRRLYWRQIDLCA